MRWSFKALWQDSGLRRCFGKKALKNRSKKNALVGATTRTRASIAGATKQITYIVADFRQKGKGFMKFQIINEELKIASCRLSDLTMEQVYGFLSQWEEGAEIGMLTLFYDEHSGYVVLNRDNKNYNLYLDIVDAYLGSSEEGRKMLEEKAPEGFQETFSVLRSAIMRRSVDENISIALKNHISSSDRSILDEIINRLDSKKVSVYIAFRYGVICGKRTERARRKRGTVA